MKEIQQQIKELLFAQGVSDVGFFADGDGAGGLKNGVSIAVRLSDAIIDEITDKPTHTYFNHYRSVNAFIDSCLLKTGLLLQQNGYKYITVAASQSINDQGWNYCGRYSYKKGAVLAGIGTVGNSGLFLHKEYGAAVRLGTVFTDCEFTPEAFAPISPCRSCNICKKVCPSGAISGKSWYAGIEREQIFSAEKCSRYMKREFKDIGRGAVCGLCIKYCPYGK